MSNFFIALAVCVITVVGALFAIPYFVDWNGYRSVFEDEASQLLGREVRVGGAVNLHFLPTPYFRFDKVRIADTSSASQDAFFRADSVTVRLSLPPLFRGVLEANEIELQKPVVRLALDGKGGWNWQSFGLNLGNAAFLPTAVSLTSVQISDGAIALHGPDGGERLRLDHLNGELGAPDIEGPYRFRGTFAKGGVKGGVEHELRFATARPEGDGSVRYKASLRLADTGSTYTVDGRLIDLVGKPRTEGELTAQLPIAALTTPAVPGTRSSGPSPKTERPAAPGNPPADAFELKSKVVADNAGARLSDLSLSFEQDGRPQLVTGEVTADWSTSLVLDMKLASRWLDLDRIAGVAEGAGPLESLVPFAIKARDILPAEGRSRAVLSVDQANIGRDTVSALRVALSRSRDRLEVEELRVGLPGGGRGELRGTVSGTDQAAVFDGDVSLRGPSLVRFASWASGNLVPPDARGDGPFGIRSHLSIASGRTAATDIVGDLSGTNISGAVTYRWEGRPEVSVLLEGPQLDARAFIPAGSSLGDMFDFVMHGPPNARATVPGSGSGSAPSGAAAGATPAPGKGNWRGAQTDTRVRINAGQLITAARTYRDVTIDLELKGGDLKLPALRLSGDEGLAVELEGEVRDAISRPKGSLRGVISANRAEGVAALAELLAIPYKLRPAPDRAQALLPLRLAGTMILGARTPTARDIVLDGEINGASAKIAARLDGGAGGWRSGPADITASLDGNEAGKLLALLAPTAPGALAGGGERAGPARAYLKAAGVPSQALTTLAAIETADFNLGFRGQVQDADTAKITGDVTLKATDGARIAALAGLSPPLRLDGVPVSGDAKLSVDDTTVTLDRLALNIAGTDVKGRIALSPGKARRRIEASLDVAELSAARLLSPLLDQRLAVAGVAEAALAGRLSPWADVPFDLAPFEAVEGTLRLSTGRFVVADGISAGRAVLAFAFDGGKIELTSLEGAALGGRVTATARLEKLAAGAEVSGTLRFADAKLEMLHGEGAGTPPLSGMLATEMKFAGRGTTPRAIVSVLQGGGTADLTGARLAALWPGAVGMAIDAALKSEPDLARTALNQGLASAMTTHQIPLPDKVAFDVVDGQLKMRPIAIETADGRTSGSMTLDLRAFAFDSEWKLEQPLPAAGSSAGANAGATTLEKRPLPGVTVGYRGTLAALGALEPRINTETLERELSVRRMERDVEELERLRKVDEQRRRSELERSRQRIEVPLPIAPPLPVTPVSPTSPVVRPAPG